MDPLLEKCTGIYSEAQIGMISHAIDYAKIAHEGQLRDSGDPYFIHPYEVALMLQDMGMDAATVIAGLLHDVLEDNTNIHFDDVRHNFSLEVAELVDGVTKLTKTNIKEALTKEEQQAENVRKMFLAMARDIRVIIIKLADRLHNMRTLEYCRSEKRVRKASETLEIYAPIAHRLGMGAMKSELEDLSFMHIYPDIYQSISEKVAFRQEEREHFLQSTMRRIQVLLAESNIHISEIHGRPKHIYSIHKKMENQKIPFEQIYDLVAIRVIVDSEKDCYGVLGVIHTHWKPLPGRFKDYIAVPKNNMYQSLHTTLLGEDAFPFEVQIRTVEMHKTAEYGIAAHWKYKEQRAGSSDLDQKLGWLRQLMEVSSEEDMTDARDFMETLRIDFFSDTVFVFTPRGDVFDLTHGATPIDFAYRVHSEVGNHCQGARVNGKLVPLDYELQTGDIIEIITSSSVQGPSRDWMNIAKTQQAKSKIRGWFKKERKEENIAKGRDMLEKEAKRQGFMLSQLLKPEWVTTMFKRHTITSNEDLFATVGLGAMTTPQVLPRLIEEYNKTHKTAEMPEALQARPKETDVHKGHGVMVKGEGNMLVRFAKCCNPVPGDEIVGFITRGRGVSVHRQSCENLISLEQQGGRMIEVAWAENERSSYNVHIHIVAGERAGLFMEISAVLMKMNITLRSINAKTDKNNTANLHLSFEIKDTAHLNNIIRQLKKVQGVNEIYRVSGA